MMLLRYIDVAKFEIVYNANFEPTVTITFVDGYCYSFPVKESEIKVCTDRALYRLQQVKQKFARPRLTCVENDA